MRRLVLLAVVGALSSLAAHYAGQPLHFPRGLQGGVPSTLPSAPAKRASATADHLLPNAKDVVWVDVLSSSKLYQGPSTQSPALPGIQNAKLIVVWRKRNGWVQLRDPVTKSVCWTPEQNIVFNTGTPVSSPGSVATPPNIQKEQTGPKVSLVSVKEKLERRRAPRQTGSSRPAPRQQVASDETWPRLLARAFGQAE